MKKKIGTGLCICLVLVCTLLWFAQKENTSIQTSSTNLENVNSLSSKKIEWGIKRNDNHEQPDLGSTNKKILDTYDGICMGNAEKKYVYLTFDEGYEAGYTPKILETLKNNNVTATFFITAHFLNTQPDLVKQMIEEGHIVGNHTPKSLMSGKNSNKMLE